MPRKQPQHKQPRQGNGDSVRRASPGALCRHLLIALLLIASAPATAASLDSYLRITATTTTSDGDAKAIELEDDEQAGKTDPNRLPDTAADPESMRSFRLMISPQVPYRVRIEGEYADTWAWRSLEGNILSIRPLRPRPYLINSPLMTVSIRY